MKKLFLFTVIVMLIGIAYSSVLLTDDFSGVVGTNLTDPANGWSAHSGAGTTPMKIASPSLTYIGYSGSGIGNATTPSGNGEDINKSFSSVNSGSIYYSFLINTAITTTATGYSMHFMQNSTTFYGRFWIRLVSGNVNFGLAKTTAAATWDPTNYSTGTTYHIVIKYTFNTGSTTDDAVYLFVNPPLGEPEPTPNVAITNDTAADATSISMVGIRQWNAGTLATFDGVIVGTEWADVASDAGGSPTVAAPTFSPGTGEYITAQSVQISSATDGASVHYSLTSETGPWTLYSSALNVSSNTTIWAYASKSGMTDSSVSTAIYTFPTITDVSDIASLRAGATDGTVYRLTGESIITFKHTTGNQKWIEDSTAAIMIYDPSGKITTNYNIGDGIENIVGTLALYNQLLEFIPVLDPGMPTSTDNPVIPTVRTLASLTSADQSKLILVENVTLGSTGTFSTSAQNINATQDVTTLTLRTFANTDYSGTTIPTTPQNIICLVGQFNSAIQISPRFLTDFASAFDYPNGTTVGTVTVTGGNANDSANQTIPEINNSSFTPSYQNVFNLIGSGPWTLTFDSTAPHGAYYQNGNWNSVVGNGSQIVMNISANKDLDLPVVLGDQDPTLPVELSSFTATLSAQNLVSLMWVTQSETGVTGYYIYRGIDTNASTAQIVSPLITATNTSTTQSYVYVDSEIFETGTYYYWLQNVDIDGTTDFHGPIRLDYVAGQNNGTPNIPVVTELKNVYPNPFNPIAFISYSLAENNPVAIKIYNNRGQLVRVLDNAPATAGNHRIEWNGMDNSGNACSTGLYLVRMTAGNKTFTQKVVLVK